MRATGFVGAVLARVGKPWVLALIPPLAPDGIERAVLLPAIISAFWGELFSAERGGDDDGFIDDERLPLADCAAEVPFTGLLFLDVDLPSLLLEPSRRETDGEGDFVPEVLRFTATS